MAKITRQDIDAIRAEAEAVEKRFNEKQDEARVLAEAGDPIPDELREETVKLRDEFVKKGEAVTKAEDEFTRNQEADQQFLATLAPTAAAVREAGTPVMERGEVVGLEVTRDSVDMFWERNKKHYGSSWTPEVRSDSERLVLDMIQAPPTQHPHRAAEFQSRLRRTQARTVKTTPDGSGGFLMPEDNTFMNEVQKAMLAFGGVANVARVITTANGRALPIPTIDDTAATGADLKAEDTTVGPVTLTFAEKSMGAYMLTSGVLQATEQAIADAGPALPGLLGMLAAERIQRTEAKYFATGTGSSQHEGLGGAFNVKAFAVDWRYKIADAKYYLGATGTTARVPYEDLIDIKYSVDAAYRASPRFSLVMSDELDRYFARAIDNDKRPLLPEWGRGNTAVGQGVRAFGMNILSDYSLSPNFAAATANQDFGFVGDFNWFWIRRASGMFMIRDPYSGAANFKTRWVFGRRSDSKGLFNTGTNPAVKAIVLDVVA